MLAASETHPTRVVFATCCGLGGPRALALGVDGPGGKEERQVGGVC